MTKIVLFVLGPDRPGIIASISRVLCEQGCNLEDVSQTILQGEFISIFIVSMNTATDTDSLLAALRAKLGPLGLYAHIRTMGSHEPTEQHPAESFVITTVGPDRPGLIAGMSEVLAKNSVNITNLKAVSQTEHQPPHYITIYEVDIPHETDFGAFRASLQARALELGLDVNLQHREIFEQIYRV
jgi:glycine cleavage system transcriptional repressor